MMDTRRWDVKQLVMVMVWQRPDRTDRGAYSSVSRC